MLIKRLGYRPPSIWERSICISRKLNSEFTPSRINKKEFYISSAILSREPLISYSGIVLDSPLGTAGLMPLRNDGQPRWFLLSPTWSIETSAVASKLRMLAVQHRWRCPTDRIVFVCNTPVECKLMQNVGEAAIVCNKTCAVSEKVYRPLVGVERKFSAIYNAQLMDWKRHELSLEVDRCAFIFYRANFIGSSATEERNLIDKHARLAPGHKFLNEFDANSCPIRLPPADVNAHLNSAHVGLCLSAVEGAMYASVEYMLAGLSVVSCPSKGGRDRFFDPDFCIVTEPTAKDVNRAVQQLISRQLNPQEIHLSTLQKLRIERLVLVKLLNDILVDAGSRPTITTDHVFKERIPLLWQRRQDVLDALLLQ